MHGTTKRFLSEMKAKAAKLKQMLDDKENEMRPLRAKCAEMTLELATTTNELKKLTA